MPLTFRDTKGSPLTSAEADANIRDLDGRIVEMVDSPPTPVEISNITATGSQFTVHMSDGSSFGPFDLPIATPSFAPLPQAEITVDVFTLITDAMNRYIRCTHVDGCTITMPLAADAGYSVDTEMLIRQAGGSAAPLTLVAAEGVTLNIPEGFIAGTDRDGATITLKHIAEDIWDVGGLLAPLP